METMLYIILDIVIMILFVTIIVSYDIERKKNDKAQKELEAEFNKHYKKQLYKE